MEALANWIAGLIIGLGSLVLFTILRIVGVVFVWAGGKLIQYVFGGMIQSAILILWPHSHFSSGLIAPLMVVAYLIGSFFYTTTANSNNT